MAAETVAQAISGIRKNFPNMDGVDNEEDAKSYVIEKILRTLGWDHTEPGEVKKEFKVGKRRADYALNPNWPTAEVFIEAKSPTVKLNDNHDYQLLNYCFQQAVDLGVLTNGRTWWLYLPMYAGPQGESLRWSQKRFCEIDIIDQTIDGKRQQSKISTAFERFLTKERVSSGDAVKAAKGIIDDREKADRAEKGMVEAWNHLVATPSEELIKMLTDSTFQICDVKPGKQQIRGFFQQHRAQFKVSDGGHSRPKLATNSGSSQQNGKLTFMFQDTRRSVKTWKQVLVELCELIYIEKQGEFDQIMSIQGTQNLYFSRNRDDLSDPKPIGDSGIFAETGSMSAVGVKDRCQKVLRAFRYGEDCFRVE